MRYDPERERQVWGMKTSSRYQRRVAAVGSVRRPSPGRTGMSETRRSGRCLAALITGHIDPILAILDAGSTLSDGWRRKLSVHYLFADLDSSAPR
jgi:hypothetical protein